MMNKRQIDLFFKTLDRELGLKGTIILTGASAGSLMGHIRPSFVFDFEIRLARKTPQTKAKLEKSIDKAAQIVGVAVNFSENIGGWSRIHYLDYRKTALPYKKMGNLEIKLIAPEYWTIGKMARFLELDIQDMIKIITKKKLKPKRLISIWAKAVRSSDLSLELGQFRNHVNYFFRNHGKKLWPQANLDHCSKQFLHQIDRSKT